VYTEPEEDRNPGKSRAEIQHRKSLEPQLPSRTRERIQPKGSRGDSRKTQDAIPWISA